MAGLFCFADEDLMFGSIPWGVSEAYVRKFVSENTNFSERGLSRAFSPNILDYIDENSTIEFKFIVKNSIKSLVEVSIETKLDVFSEYYNESVESLIKKYGTPLYLKPIGDKLYQKLSEEQLIKVYEDIDKGLNNGLILLWRKNKTAIIVDYIYKFSNDKVCKIIYIGYENVFKEHIKDILTYSEKEKKDLKDLF
ncbi:hypothetical protein E4O04_06065 [Treponema sp. OMZ 799]|uniref:hypothetical protein n=1 Tax=Treponema sp. OMZ 799 TaxID=2563668 RepID=UPI0020A3D44D|nr:hypothetical protein [Treponema sp. OMZ 799]UTC77589.1 hypothetical protein E4O04_06065 [Treponema sp. OMZ 799]